jgi:hypothetical protein
MNDGSRGSYPGDVTTPRDAAQIPRRSDTPRLGETPLLGQQQRGLIRGRPAAGMPQL